MGFFSSLFGKKKVSTAGADAAKAAAEAKQAEVTAQELQYRKELQAMQLNTAQLSASNVANSNLGTDVLTNVVAGGSASEAAADAKKRKAGSLSAMLGLNV